MPENESQRQTEPDALDWAIEYLRRDGMRDRTVVEVRARQADAGMKALSRVCSRAKEMSPEESRFRLALASFIEDHETILKTAVNNLKVSKSAGSIISHLSPTAKFFEDLIEGFRRVGAQGESIDIVEENLKKPQRLAGHHFYELWNLYANMRYQTQIAKAHQDFIDIRSLWKSLAAGAP